MELLLQRLDWTYNLWVWPKSIIWHQTKRHHSIESGFLTKWNKDIFEITNYSLSKQPDGKRVESSFDVSKRVLNFMFFADSKENCYKKENENAF